MFQTVIVKLTSFCNLDCDYCYMFNLTDKTYLEMPKQMKSDIACTIVDKVIEYLNSEGKSEFHFCLHGGEPTLWPEESFATLLGKIYDYNLAGYSLSVSIQTNLYSLPCNNILNLLRSNNIKLGVSLDGPQHYHDRHRFTRNRQGTYSKIITNLRRLEKQGYSDLFGGFLCVANPDIPPQEFWNWAKKLPITNLDILWPIQFNQANPPWINDSKHEYSISPSYGVWFAEIFELWWNEDEPLFFVRLFDNLVKIFLAGNKISHVDSLVNDQLNMFVVNVDGSIEYPDYLRAAEGGSISTGLSICSDCISDFSQDSVFSRLFNLNSCLPNECHACPFQEVCGGGFLPGRSMPGGIISDMKSVMCHDQYYFFEHVFDLINKRINMACP